VISLTGVASGLPGKHRIDRNDLQKRVVKSINIQKNAVRSLQLADGSVGLADTGNSLHQHCPGGTVYVIGACVDQASQAGVSGVTHNDAQLACILRPGGRLASAAELASLARGGLGTIPNPLRSWALELDGTEVTIVDHLGTLKSDDASGRPRLPLRVQPARLTDRRGHNVDRRVRASAPVRRPDPLHYFEAPAASRASSGSR
jgi:hypothetical protein